MVIAHLPEPAAGLIRCRLPGLLGLAEDLALFEPVAELYGFEPRGHMRVHCYAGAGSEPR